MVDRKLTNYFDDNMSCIFHLKSIARPEFFVFNKYRKIKKDVEN